MTLKIFLLYIFILFIDSLLYLSVLFTYGFTAPFHVLLIWLMYDRLLNNLTSNTFLSQKNFASIHCVLRNLALCIGFLLLVNFNFRELKGLVFSWISWLFILISFIEYWMLSNMYNKFIKKFSSPKK